MFKNSSIKKNTIARTGAGTSNNKSNKKIFCCLLFLSGSLLFITLPQLALYFISQHYNFSYGINKSIFYLIFGVLSWINSFILSLIEHEPFGGFAICVVTGVILLIITIDNFTILYQYVQYYYI